jgi:hypothetical protein
MLREQRDTVRASASITQSLRARNPSVRVANSIYDRTDQATSQAPFSYNTASIAAPSELEFEFDDMVINSQAYRRAMAHAQARTRPPNSQAEPPLGDVVDRTDNLTIRDVDIAAEAAPVPSQELQELTLHDPPARKQTADDPWRRLIEQSAAAAAAELAGDTAVVAEPEEMATAVPQAMDHSRSTTPKELVRPGHGSETGNTICAKCERLISGRFVRVATVAGNNKFHLDCFTCAVSIVPGLKFPQTPLSPH